MLIPILPELEMRSYGPESTEEEIQALCGRVCRLNESVFYFKDVAVQSIFQLNLMFGQLEKIRKSIESWYLIVDLTQTHQPNAEIREHIRQKYLSMDSPRLVALVVGKNKLIRLAIRFVAGRTLKTPYTVVETVEHALQKIQAEQEKI